VEHGIQIEEVKGAHHRSSVQLAFPCAASAVGAYLLFNEYHWESSTGFQCVVIELRSKEFHKELNTHALRAHRANPSGVTPSSVAELLGDSMQT